MVSVSPDVDREGAARRVRCRNCGRTEVCSSPARRLLRFVQTGSEVGVDEGGCSPTRARARGACRLSLTRPAASTPATPAIAAKQGHGPVAHGARSPGDAVGCGSGESRGRRTHGSKSPLRLTRYFCNRGPEQPTAAVGRTCWSSRLFHKGDGPEIVCDRALRAHIRVETNQYRGSRGGPQELF